MMKPSFISTFCAFFGIYWPFLSKKKDPHNTTTAQVLRQMSILTHLSWSLRACIFPSAGLIQTMQQHTKTQLQLL